MRRRLQYLSICAILVATFVVLSCGPGVRTIGRRSTCPLSSTFSTVDDFRYDVARNSFANRVRSDGASTVFAVGRGLGSGGLARWVVRRGESAGAVWVTLDDYRYNSGADSEANDFHQADDGKMYAVGYGATGTVDHWLVRRSNDKGTSWEVVDDYVFTAGQDSRAQAVTSDRLGNIFVAGFGSNGTSDTWIVRKSEDKGATWEVIDEFKFGTATSSRAAGIAVDDENTVYATGNGIATGGASRHWLTRKLINDGNAWTTVDDFHADLDHAANDIAYDGNGNLYVTGYGETGTQFNGFTRKSTNEGSTWATVDEFDFSTTVTNSTTIFWGIAVDPASNPYVMGSSDVSGEVHWIVRSSSQGGGWASIDDFILAGGESSFALGGAFDSVGNLFIAGHGIDQATRHWLVRTAPCQ